MTTGRHQEKEIAKSMPRINNKEQVPMSDEDLIPAENLNSGFNLTKLFLLTVSKSSTVLLKKSKSAIKRSSFFKQIAKYAEMNNRFWRKREPGQRSKAMDGRKFSSQTFLSIIFHDCCRCLCRKQNGEVY
jgi:hypothetical protein